MRNRWSPLRKWITPLFLFFFTFAIYLCFYRGEGKIYDYFVPLANAFLHNKYYVENTYSYLNELIKVGDRYFVVYPPMPAIVEMPFVAIFKSAFSQPVFSIFIGSLNVAIFYEVLKKLFNLKTALLTSLLFAFGTIHWYHAEVGSAWYIAHIIAIFFILLMLFEVTHKKRLFVIGLFIGAAYLSRLPAILAVAFPLLYLREEFISRRKGKVSINFRNLSLLLAGLSPFIFFNFYYNYIRYGVISDISYRLLPVFNEPWYKNGLFSVKNIPIHLREILTSMPSIRDKWPYIVPDMNSMALWLLTPAFFSIIFADFKKKLITVSAVTVVIMSIPGLVHGSNGFSQIGFRFALDYLPFLLILTASGINKHPRIGILLIILSIMANAWSVIMVSVLGIRAN